jgi:hypothetical protein
MHSLQKRPRENLPYQTFQLQWGDVWLLGGVVVPFCLLLVRPDFLVVLRAIL